MNANVQADSLRQSDYDGPITATLAEFGHGILRRWWVVAGIATIVVLLALAASLAMTPQYRATTTLQIEREAMKVVNMEDLMPTESPMDRDFYQTQYELLMSRSLARRVITKAGLANHPVYKENVEAALEKFDEAAAGKRASDERA